MTNKKRQKEEEEEEEHHIIFTGRISESMKYDEIKINYLLYKLWRYKQKSFFPLPLHLPSFTSAILYFSLTHDLCLCVCVCGHECVASGIGVSKTKFNLSLSVHTKENCQRWWRLMPTCTRACRVCVCVCMWFHCWIDYFDADGRICAHTVCACLYAPSSSSSSLTTTTACDGIEDDDGDDSNVM